MSERTPTSVLSDGTIRQLVADRRIRIDPWDESLVQPASVDLRLGDSFRVFHNHRASVIDLRDPPQHLTEEVKIAGDEPFVIHPGEFALGRTLEWVELPDDIVARIEGKALALDTHVPTPEGWKLMGELQVGDEVFDHDGLPTTVVAATAPMLGRPCREVVLSDRTRIVADLSHQWEVLTKTGRSRRLLPRILTTEQIEQTLRQGREYGVALAGPVEYPEKDLPIPPYVLGARLGGGTSTAAIVISADDESLHEPELSGSAAAPASGLLSRRLPVMGDKHIRRDYMQGSIAQRRALLAGQYHEPRKLARQGALGRLESTRAIVDVRSVESVPVRCIEVASPRGVFLVTRSFVPTHNSSLGRLGLIVHATAGFCDPGWRGTLTLELANLTRVPIRLYHGLAIAQLSFMTLDAPAERPYGHDELGSHYQGQVDATASRYGQPKKSVR